MDAGRRPSSTARTCSAQPTANRVIASSVCEAMCGVKMMLSRPSSGSLGDRGFLDESVQRGPGQTSVPKRGGQRLGRNEPAAARY